MIQLVAVVENNDDDTMVRLKCLYWCCLCLAPFLGEITQFFLGDLAINDFLVRLPKRYSISSLWVPISSLWVCSDTAMDVILLRLFVFLTKRAQFLWPILGKNKMR